MKDAYFLPDTVQNLSSQWLEKYGKPNKVLRHRFKLREVCPETFFGKWWIVGGKYLSGNRVSIYTRIKTAREGVPE